MDDFGKRSRELARRFLRTAVVVDDEAFMAVDEGVGPKGEVVAPGRRALERSRVDEHSPSSRPRHTLDARSIMDSFSELDVICGVIGPTRPPMEAMKQADIVVLDWLLQDRSPDLTLELLRYLLADESDRNSLRLVAIYTGEASLEEIGATVLSVLRKAGLAPKEKGHRKAVISYGHGHVVLYAKSAVNLAASLQERSVAEADLPQRLINDFADMTEGLLPSIAVASLTAVREGEHKVLDRFSADMDPAFLTHRICLPNPEDAERQMVNHIAEELRGLMDNAVAEESPAGAKAVEGWIRRRGVEGSTFRIDKKELDLEQVIALTKKGLKDGGVLTNKQQEKAFRNLSATFASDDGTGLDEQLAWLMSFRTVHNAPPPTLWLGSVVTGSVDGKHQHLLCMRPRCDCVRLTGETSFVFLPLLEASTGNQQLVVRLDNEFKRLGVGFDPAGWVLREFKPSEANQAVTATKRECNAFEFTDTCGNRFQWQGELKAEYSQRIAQTFTARLSRVAVDESEWLRRIARVG